MNINGIDKLTAGSQDYKLIMDALGENEASKIDDDELLFKTMQYYATSNFIDEWSADAKELELEDLIAKWKEMDDDDKSFAADFDEFSAYMNTYQKETPPPPPPGPEGGETDQDGIIEFNGVRYEVYRKFNGNATEKIKWSKTEDGRTLFESNGWNITVIGAMNDTGDPNYANVIVTGDRNTFFGSNDNDTIEVRGNSNNIHGDTSDVNGGNDKITITSGTGNYVYGEEGDDDLDTIPNNMFNLAIKDVEVVNGEEQDLTPPTPQTSVKSFSNISPEEPQENSEVYAFADAYALNLLGKTEGDTTGVSRNDLAEFGINVEEGSDVEEVLNGIRIASDLTQQLEAREILVDENGEETLGDRLNVVNPQNVLYFYNNTTDDRMKELCLVTGMIEDDNGVAKIVEDAQESLSTQDVFKIALRLLNLISEKEEESE